MAKTKSTAKKSTAKKSTAKKSTAKKSTAKKSTAKKSTAKKSTAKKRYNSVSQELDMQERYFIPEVPTNAKKSNLSSKLINNKNQISYPDNLEEKTSKTGKSKLYIILLLVTISTGAVYYLNSSPQKISIENSQPPTNIIEEDSKVTEVKTFNLEYLYNSTGISINLNNTNHLGTIKNFKLIVKYNNLSNTLGNYTGSTSSIKLTKSDTVGKSVFTLVATLFDGTEVTSKPLTIKGKFEK